VSTKDSGEGDTTSGGQKKDPDGSAAETIDANKAAPAGNRPSADPLSHDTRRDISAFASSAEASPHKRRYMITRSVLVPRISELEEVENELEAELQELSKTNPKVEAMKRELDGLAQFMKMMEQQLMLREANALARPRVNIVQKAVVQDID
jgi:hypothetical protein